ncbi:hypothetical protein [Herbiconiux liukaitaii]|uniref:hypothetical protein n=1 Tax=Herbiconiux liukaitaii TaxID=3342799 RepID=UPI0035B8D348
MGEFTIWPGLMLGVVVMAVGVVLVLRRQTMSARSPQGSQWHLSERFVLVGGIVLVVAGALVVISRFL